MLDRWTNQARVELSIVPFKRNLAQRVVIELSNQELLEANLPKDPWPMTQ